VAWIRFDKRRASFGISSPEQNGRRLRGKRRTEHAGRDPQQRGD
jgi:hypothetical protein